MNFEINLIFLIKPFFLHEQTVMIKTNISWEWRELLIWKKKKIFFIVKELSMKQITQVFLEGEGLTLNGFETEANRYKLSTSNN